MDTKKRGGGEGGERRRKRWKLQENRVRVSEREKGGRKKGLATFSSLSFFLLVFLPHSLTHQVSCELDVRGKRQMLQLLPLLLCRHILIYIYTIYYIVEAAVNRRER